MLTLSDDIRFESLCKINLKAYKAEFRGVFKLLPESEVDALLKQNLETREFARRVMVGWVFGDVTNPAGEPLVFSPEAFEQVLSWPGAAMAIFKGFMDGYSPATEGNSDAPSAGS
jgi:hypothetical protein